MGPCGAKDKGVGEAEEAKKGPPFPKVGLDPSFNLNANPCHLGWNKYSFHVEVSPHNYFMCNIWLILCVNMRLFWC